MVYREKRGWGNFEQFCLNEQVTVKFLNVLPYSALSLQYHLKRDEFWRIVQGVGEVTIDDKVYRATEGKEFTVMRGQQHRVRTYDFPLQILEISRGVFEESDIIRLKDDYGRK